MTELTKEEIINLLKERTCEVVFVKKDGTERTMLCTLQDSVIKNYLTESASSSTRKKSDEVIAVLDMEKTAWRSFRVDSVISIKKMDSDYRLQSLSK